MKTTSWNFNYIVWQSHRPQFVTTEKNTLSEFHHRVWIGYRRRRCCCWIGIEYNTCNSFTTLKAASTKISNISWDCDFITKGSAIGKGVLSKFNHSFQKCIHSLQVTTTAKCGKSDPSETTIVRKDNFHQ